MLRKIILNYFGKSILSLKFKHTLEIESHDVNGLTIAII
jgi:hypothetical protein